MTVIYKDTQKARIETEEAARFDPDLMCRLVIKGTQHCETRQSSACH